MDEWKGLCLPDKKAGISLQHQEKGAMSSGRDISHFQAADAS